MNYDKLVQIAQNDPELFKLIQERTPQILDEVAGPQVLTKSGGHFSADKRIAGSLRDGMKQLGKDGGGRTGFLMQAKGGDMSSIGGPKLSADVLKNAESPHSQFSRPAQRKVDAYNAEFANVADILKAGDSSGMKNTAGGAAAFGEKQGSNNFFNWQKKPTLLNANNPVPEKNSYLDLKSGRTRANLDDVVSNLTKGSPVVIDPKIKPYVDKVFEKTVQELPLDRKNAMGPFKSGNALQKDGMGLSRPLKPKMPWEQMAEDRNLNKLISASNPNNNAFVGDPKYLNSSTNPLLIGAQQQPKWNMGALARQQNNTDWGSLFNNPSWQNSMGYNQASWTPSVRPMGGSSGAMMGGGLW